MNLMVVSFHELIGNNQSNNHPNRDAAKHPKGHDETRVAFKTGGAGDFDICQADEQPGNAPTRRPERKPQDGKCKPARQ